MKIAFAQLNFCVGAIEKNAERIVNTIAHTEADFIIFPELTLSGYPPEDLLFRTSFHQRCEDALQHILNHTKDKTIVMGYPEKKGDCCFNKALVIQEGRIIASYSKCILPNDTVFDEKRYFTAGNKSCVFEWQGLKIGLLICEDLWHAAPAQQAKQAGADCLLVINASPYDHTKSAARLHTIKQRIAETQLPILYCNLVGGQDELLFDGESMGFNAQGECGVCLPRFTEETRIFHFPFQQSIKIPQLSWEAQNYAAIQLGLQDYVQKNGFKQVCLGLSGGIDSALTLAIAVDSLGPTQVTALLMPSPYTAQISIEDALTQCKILGVAHHLISIDACYTQFLESLASLFKHTTPDLSEENIQARIRATLLMAYSNKFNALLLSTGNKSELSVGYCTLYGDMAGAFAPIKDLYKTEVYRLAQYRNTLSPVIPERVITRAPSAELRENQTDQDNLPPYEVLDAILKKYIESEESIDDIVKAGFSSDLTQQICTRVDRNEYKRRQAPMGVRLTRHSFGKDRRYPVSGG